ncbi:TonB-dependent siderophore receptor [Algihabitans albus]|uniref:TonB-dependent siderophore receptor n=1 Tax=Algihabitans albus TaxID=2164067 RepID=UPI0013C2D19F|nr:TonB-dependent receptor [Algihabitans albus]
MTASAIQSAQSGQTDVLQIDLPSQSLSDALRALSRQSGLQFFADSDLTRDLTAPPVSGRMSAEEALRQLLAGSGLDYRIGETGAVTLERTAARPENGPLRLQPITVDAVLGGIVTDSYAAPDSFGATRTDTPVIDTPQSTQAVTRQALDDAGATDIADAYDYLAGIQRDINAGGVFGDAYLARGFETDNILFNGNRTGRPATLDTANVERVQALRGPTAALFGRADPGGLINIVTKQPLAEPFYQTDLSFGSGFFGDGNRFREGRATVDAGGPIDSEGRLRYRLNAAAEREKTFRQDIDETLFFVSPVVDFEIDEATVANVELIYQYRRDVFDRGVPFIDGEPELSPDWNVAEGQDEMLDKHFLSGTFRLDREFTASLTGRMGLYGSYGSLDGEGFQVASVMPATAQRLGFEGSDLFLTAQPELVAEFGTGSIGHTLLFGIDASYQRNRSRIPFGLRSPAFDIFDPDFPVDIPELSAGTENRFNERLTAKSVGVYIQDQIDLTEQWKLLAGLRWDNVWLTEESFTTAANDTFLVSDLDEDLHDNALLPRAGIVYQPIEQIGLYASYAQTYRPPVVGGLTDANGERVDPEEGRSLEVGIKLEALDGKLGGTLAAFRADKENVLEADPGDPFSNVNLGRVRSEGVELNLNGEITENFSLGLSYAYTDARIDSNDNPNFPRGTRIRNVPRHAASLQAAYRFTEGSLDGLRLFGGVVYEGEKPADTTAADDTSLPDFLRVDLGASYDLTESIQTRLQIQNLTDKEYYVSGSTARNIVPGQPFNATLGIRVRF